MLKSYKNRALGIMFSRLITTVQCYRNLPVVLCLHASDELNKEKMAQGRKMGQNEKLDYLGLVSNHS